LIFNHKLGIIARIPIIDKREEEIVCRDFLIMTTRYGVL